MTEMVLRSKMKRTGQTAAAETDLRAETDVKVSLISKIAYGMGDVGCNFSWMFVGNFLMIFYTDVFGISMGAVAGLMLFSRFWDAVNDPIIGSLTDRIHSRWWRYRPWLLVAAPLTAVVHNLGCTVPARMGPEGQNQNSQDCVHGYYILYSGFGIYLRQYPVRDPVRGHDPEHRGACAD